MFKKLLISGVAVFTTLSSSGFAQSVPFDETYNKLIDQVVSEQIFSTNKASDGISSEGSSNFSLKSKGDLNMDMSANIFYNQIFQQRRTGNYGEGNISIDSTMNFEIRGYIDIKNLKIQGNIDFKFTPATAFVKINSLSINTNTLPAEMKGEIENMISTLLTKAQGKWIKIILPKELRDQLKQGQELSPSAIITLLKNYPLVKNAGYKNNAFSVELNTDNIVALLTKYNIISNESEYKSMFDKQTYDEYFAEKRSDYGDNFKMYPEFVRLSYDDYVNLYTSINNSSLLITKSNYNRIVRAFANNSKNFLTLVKKENFNEEYNETSDTVIYLESYYDQELKTHTLEEVWYYDQLLQSLIIPSQGEFENFTYGSFLEKTYNMDTGETFLANQKEWNEYVEATYNPEAIKKQFKEFIGALPVQGTLSTNDAPTLQLTIKSTEDFPFNSSLTISKNNIRISGDMKDSMDYGDGAQSTTDTKFSASIQSHNNNLQYDVNFSLLDNPSWYEPSSLLFNISGKESYKIHENYKFIRPKGAISNTRFFSSFHIFE